MGPSPGITLTAAEAAQIAQGTLLGDPKTPFGGLSTDSRTLQPGQAFLALRGDRFDGQAFLPQAIAAGARLLIVQSPTPALPDHVTVLRVTQTIDALAALARAWRHTVNPRVIAITGSVGKTTAKEFLRAILIAHAGATRVHANRGNLNNQIGLPLSLLEMPRQTDFLACELGMNRAGEIAALATIAKPDVGVITAIAPVHLEHLGSIEAVAAAKAELIGALPVDGQVVVPSDELTLTPHLTSLGLRRVIYFGPRPSDAVCIGKITQADRSGSTVELSLAGQCHAVRLTLPGAHQARNAAAAAAAALAVGVPPATIVSGLHVGLSLAHRSVVRHVGRFWVLDDCYNANPVAMQAALATLVALAGSTPRIAVLGQMAELGEASARYHRELGAHAATCALTGLITVGATAAAMAAGARDAGMAPDAIVAVAQAADALPQIARTLPRGGWLLLKGSRSSHLEDLLPLLESTPLREG